MRQHRLDYQDDDEWGDSYAGAGYGCTIMLIVAVLVLNVIGYLASKGVLR